MIKVSTLQQVEFVVNADLIEFIESTPDTMISLTTGKKIMVSETMDEVLDRILAYKQQINQSVEKKYRRRRRYWRKG